MCGLAAIARIGTELGPDCEQVLRRMSRAIAHRGPDGDSLVLDGQVGLAFRSLGLVGREGCNQPLYSLDRSVRLISNGEVYNHRELASKVPGLTLYTESDCEVLAHLYAERGQRFLDEVRGMFAIVLHDARRSRLVLARDRFGIKPLYYTRVADIVVVASEVKALFEFRGCPREVDWQAALGDRALHGAPILGTEPVNTWFRGIKQVPAASVLTIDLADGSEDLHQYWQLPDFSGPGEGVGGDLIGEYRRLLAESVADCVSADAGIGLFLSGGIDSAAVAALAAEAGSRINTFTVCNASTVLNGDAQSAQLVASHCGLSNCQLAFPADRGPSAEEWKNLLWLLETPLCSPAQFLTHELYRYVSSVYPGIKGIMLGQASDEFNGGYSTVFSGTGTWAGFEASLRELARAAAVRYVPRLQPWLQHSESFLLSDALLKNVPGGGAVDDPYQLFIETKYRDIQQYNCWHEDRTAAGNGIEARVPFLDHRIIELLARIPVARRGELLWDKEVLRSAVSDLLPEGIVRRRKVAFYHDIGVEHTHKVFRRMLSGQHAALVEESLASAGARRNLNVDAVRAWLAVLPEGDTSEALEYLLRLINLGLLDAMVGQAIQPPIEARAVARLARPSVHVGPIEGEALAWDLCGVSTPGSSDSVSLAAGVEMVAPLDDPHILYLAVNGQLEYVISAESDPDWFGFLRALRPGRRLGETLRQVNINLDDIQTLLRQCIAAGIIEVNSVPSSPAQSNLPAR